MSLRSAAPSHDAILNGRSVLTLLAAFFGVVFAVNGYFAVEAITTYSGTVASEPYRKGLTYNRRIAADERQRALHWQASLTAARDGQARFDLATSDGTPVPGLTVIATLGRPSSDDQDHTLTFTEPAPGHYVAVGPAIDPGTWVIALQARDVAGAPEPVFQMRKRLWLAP